MACRHLLHHGCLPVRSAVPVPLSDCRGAVSPASSYSGHPALRPAGRPSAVQNRSRRFCRGTGFHCPAGGLGAGTPGQPDAFGCAPLNMPSLRLGSTNHCIADSRRHRTGLHPPCLFVRQRGGRTPVPMAAISRSSWRKRPLILPIFNRQKAKEQGQMTVRIGDRFADFVVSRTTSWTSPWSGQAPCGRSRRIAVHPASA